jgi:hypothetical protein
MSKQCEHNKFEPQLDIQNEKYKEEIKEMEEEQSTLKSQLKEAIANLEYK